MQFPAEDPAAALGQTTPVSARIHELGRVIEATLSRVGGRGVRFELHGPEIVVRGIVGTYYQKQLVQESLRTIDGISRIHNEIEVQ